jgi:hypothetical protein
LPDGNAFLVSMVDFLGKRLIYWIVDGKICPERINRRTEGEHPLLKRGEPEMIYPHFIFLVKEVPREIREGAIIIPFLILNCQEISPRAIPREEAFLEWLLIGAKKRIESSEVLSVDDFHISVAAEVDDKTMITEMIKKFMETEKSIIKLPKGYMFQRDLMIIFNKWIKQNSPEIPAFNDKKFGIYLKYAGFDSGNFKRYKDRCGSCLVGYTFESSPLVMK